MATESSEISGAALLAAARAGEAQLDRLPPPESSPAARVRTGRAFDLASAFYATWQSLLKDGPSTTLPAKTQDAIDEWNRRLFITGCYYVYLHKRMMRIGLPKAESLMPGMHWETIESMVGSMDDEMQLQHMMGKRLCLDYFIAAKGAYYTSLFHGAALHESLVAGFEGVSHRVVRDLQFVATQVDGPYLVALGERLLEHVLDILARAYTERDKSAAPPAHVGPFSAIRTADLPLLAARDSRLTRRYKGQPIERVFEQQLALIAQSCGFYVVSTRIAERTVDLICISADPSAAYTCLIEAKSTTRNYSLPTDHSRALEEYVHDVVKTLTTVPPLRFVLVVGPTPARTLPTKLQELEVRIGIPVRYIEATHLARLRELLPGPVPLGPFAEAILHSTPVVASSVMDGIALKFRQLQTAHSEFVQAMMKPSKFGLP
jgi:hypothetical protein